MKRAGLCVAFIFICTIAFATITPFESSRQNAMLKRSLESALAEKNKSAFLLQAEQAAELAYVQWEQEALYEYEKMQESGLSELAATFENLKTNAKGTIALMLLEAEGRFDARCAEIVMPQYAKEELLAKIQQMNEQSPAADMVAAYQAWDEAVGVYVQELLFGINTELEQNREEVISDIVQTVEAYRDAFIREIDTRIAAIKKQAYRDIELYYIGARNAYMTTHFADTKSLRHESELESAEAITENILSQTYDEASALSQQVEEKLAYTVNGVGIPQSDDIEALVQAGIYAWKAAEDKLIAARFEWERTALTNYDLMDEAWAKALETLVQKRNEWYTNIQRQIRQGIINWQESFLETDSNFADALRLLDETIQAEVERFDDYSASIRDLIVTGSASLKIAYENIGWLREYSQSLSDSNLNDSNNNYEQVKQAVDKQIQDWTAIISRYNELVAQSALQYHQQDMWATQKVFVQGEFVANHADEATDLARSEEIFKKLFVAIREGKIGSAIQATDAYAFDDELRKQLITIQFVYLLSEQFVLFDDAFGKLTKRYGVNAEQYKDNLAAVYNEYYINHTINCTGGKLQAKPGSSSWLAARLDNFRQLVLSTDGSFEKLFGYTTTGSGLLADNRYDESGNPLYRFYWYQDQQGVVLINDEYPVTHDPYLMTQAEFELEKEKLTLAYWEERYQRAKKLYDYAYNEAGRPDAQTQKENLQQAINAYTTAKQDYTNAMERLKGELKDAMIAAQEDVDRAKKALDEVRIAYEYAQINYQHAVEGCLVYTNPLSREMAIQMVQEAAGTILQIKNSIQHKEKKLFTAKLDYYKALILSERHGKTAEYAARVEKAIRALEGTGEVQGFRGAYDVWNGAIATKSTLDDVIEAIEENSDALFVKVEDLFFENPEDEAIGFLTLGVKRRNEAKEIYEQAVEIYNQWKHIYEQNDSKSKAHEMVAYILTGMLQSTAEENNLQAMVTWEMIQEQLEYVVSDNITERENAITLLQRYSAGCVHEEELRNILEELSELNASKIKEDIEALLLTNVYMKVYGTDAGVTTDDSVLYAPCTVLYSIYETKLNRQYTDAAAQVRRAVAHAGQIIQELYEVSLAVVEYCIKDMRNEDLETSPFTKASILKAAEDAEKRSAGDYFAITQLILRSVTEKLEDYRQELAAEQEAEEGDHAVSGNAIFEEMYALCKDKIVEKGTINEGLQHAYILSVLSLMEKRLRAVTSADKLDEILQDANGLIQDLDVVRDVYENEVSTCTTDAAFQELINKYSSMIETGKDSNGNDLTEEQKKRANIAYLSLIHPEMYDLVRPVTDESQRRAFVMTEYARYVEKFYESSLEYYRRVKEEGFIGTIARILGINTADDVVQELSGQLTVEKLLQYGANAEKFVQTREFEELPQALRQALLSVVDRYHGLLTKKALYENKNTSMEAARSMYTQAETVYQKLTELQQKYAQLIELRMKMYGDEVNSYTQKRDVYYEVVPKGIWPGYTDEMIVMLRQCESIYTEIKTYIDNTAFNEIQVEILAQLSNLEKLRHDYEVVDYTARYCADSIGAYGSLNDYCQRMRLQGKSEEFIATVRSEIEKQLAKRETVQQLLQNQITPLTVSQEAIQWAHAAYYEGIQSAVGDVQHFNAFAYDNDFVRYALALHFQSYVNKALQNGEVPSLKELFGYINSDNSFVAGSFAALAQYTTAEALKYFKDHYEDFSALYYETLTDSLLASAYSIQNATVFNPENKREVLAHFLAYCIELADDDGIIQYDFEEVFGTVENTEFVASGFTELAQYSDGDMQQYFADHYELFKQLFIMLQNDTAALSFAWLPDGVREYALKREYYLQRKEGMGVDSVERLFAYYGVDTEDSEMRSNVEDFVRLTTIALDWDRQTPLQEYLDTHDITDEKERNYVILASLYPELADPVNLIVSDSQVPLVLTGLRMQNAENTLFEILTKDDEDGLQSLLALCLYAAGRDKTIAHEVYQFIVTTRDTFTHYRDYLPQIKQYYEEYAPNNDTPGPFKDFIVNDVEKLKDRKLVKIENTNDANNWNIDIDSFTNWYNSLTPENKQKCAGWYEYVINEYKKQHSVDYKYYDDANSNGQHDEGEKYLADFLDEYRASGYGLIIENKQITDINEIVTDAVGTNSMGYFTGDSRSYFNAILEEASTMALQLDVLVNVAQWAVKESSGFVFTDDDDQEINILYIRDYDEFIDEISLRMNNGGDSFEEENNSEGLSFAALQEYLNEVIQGGNDARVSELVKTMGEKNAGIEKALIDAYKNIEKMGIILENANLEQYLNSEKFKNAKDKYEKDKESFEKAQNELNSALNAYSRAQDEYSRQLEIISILYNRLDEARKLKEDEELLYAYASNPYLYNSETNAEGGDAGISKLKADAQQQFELAQKYRDEVKQRIQALQQKAEEVKNQNVENDEQYVKLRKELQERAQRAYRMEKLAMCMQNEIKQLSLAYDEAKSKYEASKNAFLQATGKEYENERDRLIDTMIDDSFINGVTVIHTPSGDLKQSTLLLHLNTAAYYYNKNHSQFGLDERILSVKPYFGSIPSGNEIVDMNSPLYMYLLMMREDDSKIMGNQYIQEYFNEFLRARNCENKYDNLMFNYLGTYKTLYIPHKKVYDYLYNKTIKILGKKIHPLRKIAKSYFKAVLSPILALLDIMYKPIREAESNMKTHNNSAKSVLNNIRAKLTQLQSQKIVMLKAKANLARYIEIESLDDEQAAGSFVYYNPETMQKIAIPKPTLKEALRQIAAKYNIAIQDSDLQYMVTAERGSDYVNVSRFTETAIKTDENGYETGETMPVYHAGNVSQTYANIMNQQRRDYFARYINYTKTMYTQKGYDRVIIDRAVEKELFKQFAEDGQSALQIGAESKGSIRAMIVYMGYVEGIPENVINELDEMIGTDSEQDVSSKFAQYVKQYEGINDRELKQRHDLQVHQWQLTKKLLQDKKDDWDRMVNRIFERGVRQWDMMLQSFANSWKNWQNDTKDKIAAGNRQWDERMKQLQEAKFQWFADAQKGISAKELHKRLSGLEVTLNELLSHMKEKYGDTIGKVDVHALLLDILKEQPELLREEVMTLTRAKVEFGLTQLTTRKYNGTIFNEAHQLAQEFAVAQQKTQNIQLLKALTELLKRCSEQLEAANEQAGLA
ncbi:MAG: hypothetical protein WBK20_01895, partial [Spirochaetota bacterium]